MLLAENLQKIDRSGLSRCNDFHLSIVFLKSVQYDISLKSDCKHCAADRWEACQTCGLRCEFLNSNQKHDKRCLFSGYGDNHSP